MTTTFNICELPRGRTIIAPGAWGTNGVRHGESGLPVITKNGGETRNDRLPSQVLVVLGLLEGQDGFDGVVVASYLQGEAGDSFSAPMALCHNIAGISVNGPMMGKAQFADRDLPVYMPGSNGV